jgi:hypothetical protein
MYIHREILLRKNLFLSCLPLFVLIISLVVPVEADSIFWAYSFETRLGGFSRACVIATSDGGYAVAGEFNDRALLFKTDAYGNMEWNKTYHEGGWSDDGGFRSLVETSNGGYAMAGHTDTFGRGVYDCWFVKTDAYGNVEWNHTYGGAHNAVVYSLIVTSDGGYAIAGARASKEVIQFDAWLAKTDAYGNMEWNKTYGKFGVEDFDFFYSVVETSDGGFAIAGSQYIMGLVDGKWTEGDKNFWLVKTNSFGNIIWEKKYGGAREDIACSMVKASDGGYAIAGTSRSFGNGDKTFWLVKTDEYGNMEWNKTVGGTGWKIAYSMIRTSDGGYAIAGRKNGDFWLVKTDAYGNMEWNKTVGRGGDAVNIPDSLAEAHDGGYIIVGSITMPVTSSRYILLVKTDETGYFEGTIPSGVIPEYHSLLLPLLLLVATLVIVINKKRVFQVHKNTKQ